MYTEATMIPINEASVVGLMHWISRNCKDVRSFKDMEEPVFLALVRQYELSHDEPVDILDQPNLLEKWKDAHSFLSLRGKGLLQSVRRSTAFSFFGSRFNGLHPAASSARDELARYLEPRLKSMFFLTSEDVLLTNHIREHWDILHSMSADAVDIYAYFRHRNPKFNAYEQMKSVRSIPGVRQIRGIDLPCIIFWHEDNYAIVSLNDSTQTQQALTQKLRYVFSQTGASPGRALGTRADPQEALLQLGEIAIHTSQRMARELYAKPTRETPPSNEIFISYKHAHRNKIETLADGLKQAGMKVWFDAYIEQGQPYQWEISKHLVKAWVVIVAFSRDVFPSGGDNSGWVIAEAEAARNRLGSTGRYIPILIESGNYLEVPFNIDQTTDLAKWLNTKPPSFEHPSWLNFLKRIRDLDSGRS